MAATPSRNKHRDGVCVCVCALSRDCVSFKLQVRVVSPMEDDVVAEQAEDVLIKMHLDGWQSSLNSPRVYPPPARWSDPPL